MFIYFRVLPILITKLFTTMKKTLLFLPILHTNIFRIASLCIVFLSYFTHASYAQQPILVGSIGEFHKTIQDAHRNVTSKIAGKPSMKISSAENLTITITANEKKGTHELFTGKVNSVKHSQVFFSFENNNLKGKVILTDQKKAYSYSSKNGMVYVVPEKIENVICIDYVQAQTVVASSVAVPAPPPGSNVYTYESLPGATAVAMLDFDGHNSAGSWWGTIDALPADVTEDEITDAWKLVSEDFSPFQLNITTNEAIYQAAPADRRMRCIFTPTTDAAPGSGGVAFIGTFTTGGELAPCWVYNIGSGKVMGETASHEIGHTMGLLHDGREIPDTGHEEYYGGQGVWAPIMGVSYYSEVSHWSIGEYQYANNTEDDIAKIGGDNGFSFRPDAQGNTFATAAQLMVGGNGEVSASLNYGVVANNMDTDMFWFTTTGSTIDLTIQQASSFPDLNILAELYNQQGQLITSSDPPGIAPAILNLALAAGTYYISVRGVGEGNPFIDGYSNYSSIGNFSISGTLHTTPITCNDYIRQLPNGDIKFVVTFPTPQAYVEVFATKNDVQYLATNIVGSQLLNGDGSYTYSYTEPASFYQTSDKIAARFYSHTTGGPAIFTPGPSEMIWSPSFYYNQTNCPAVTTPSPCNDMVQQLKNGYMAFTVTFPTKRAYVEVFAQKNGIQYIAANVAQSETINSNGTYTYQYITPASMYVTGDILKARFYSYTTGGPGEFTPGPAEGIWSPDFIYNQSVCQSCNDIYESNETPEAAKTISVNTSIFAQINTSSDKDWFSFTTTASNPNVQITLTNLVVDFDIYLYDINGNYIGGSANGGSLSEVINYSSSLASTYFIQVLGYVGNYNTQCYSLKASTSGSPFTRIGYFAETPSANNKKSDTPGLSFFPNPAKSGSEIIVKLNNDETQTIRILDMRGLVVSEQKITASDGQALLNLSGIEVGVYVLDAGTANKQKLVIE
jgi:hypothetical protein